MTDYAIDLHTHSTASDGLYAPRVLVQKAYEVGVRVLALTDHDSTEGVAEAAEAATQLGIDFIPGIEINTETSAGEVHMLGYFLHYQQEAFQQALRTLRDARQRRGQRMVELLNEQGIAIRWERVRELAQGAVGRPHVAQALVEAGYAQSIEEAFARYLSKGCPAYVPRYKLSPQDAVRLIVSARGLPVIAHPLELPGPEILRQWLPELCALGLVGLEVYYGPYTAEQETLLLSLARQFDLIPTGGSDYHGPGIHPTPLGGHPVPAESVTRLQEAAAARSHQTPPPFTLPEPAVE
ncbi:MAG: PHP domain-containing protein [Thermogemmatispora sp.]|uniref:PHP domain-containing protein n=1 Tax=Thermogemmatispora sp. TaxID=1968838 RepID=UPI002636B363|nr:PHP domain-containing protein [Thermogemmatispora sp.]MBX5456881.1 PHP domain-containing protein [Thermogemmatispora sp.]